MESEEGHILKLIIATNFTPVESYKHKEAPTQQPCSRGMEAVKAQDRAHAGSVLSPTDFRSGSPQRPSQKSGLSRVIPKVCDALWPSSVLFVSVAFTIFRKERHTSISNLCKS